MANRAPHIILQRLHENRGILFPLSCIGLLVVLLVPLPTQVLDLLLVLNITLSVIVLVTTMYVQTPLEFAVFPSLLLAVTLFRLVLNVATTRLILTADRLGDVAAAHHAGGEVVLAFSNFVAGDKIAVGAVIFLIIFVIQFVVITKGCARISEVAARFILDAMPGKQMAIDADVAAGAVSEADARRRRDEISQQADFYGAMDGASKFVRGDAIAGILITAINILGGLYIGIIEKGWSPDESAKLFTRLTIGDGLVSQVPAFIVSLAAGLIVTRSSDRTELGEQVIGQMLAKPKALIVAAAFLMLLSVAGLPAMPLMVMAGACAMLAYLITKRDHTTLDATDDATEADQKEQPEPVEKFLELSVLELEIGPGLIKLADSSRGGDLLERIHEIRKKVAIELGLIVPAVRVHDNPELSANDYIIKIRGMAVGRGVTYPEQYLAVAAHDASEMPDAEHTACPVTSAPAYWITESQLTQAGSLAYEIIEAPEVLTTHLAETIRTHAQELLTRQEVKNLLENLKQRSPALVDEVVPNQLKIGELHRVLQNLLRERVSIRDLETILESLADCASRTKDLDELTEHVRRALARSICHQYTDDQNRLACVTLDPDLEQQIVRQVTRRDARDAALWAGLPPQQVQELVEQLTLDHASVVLCSAPVRAAVRRMLEISLPRVAVLSFSEISPDVSIHTSGKIEAHQARGLEPA
ncbi:MAG TPA: flagellar biosynthesis protein FlhA [Tepidisphaeraceae bacterium]|jgi:flagellar biosynthesis protein FlhA